MSMMKIAKVINLLAENTCSFERKVVPLQRNTV